MYQHNQMYLQIKYFGQINLNLYNIEIMKTIKILNLIMLSLLLLTSCIDDTVDSSENVNSPSLVGFTKSRQTVGVSADGNPHDYATSFSVSGPTSSSLNGDIDLTLEVDSSSTAIEGTHYNIDDLTSTIINSDGVYSGSISFTVLTAGIIPPMDVAPKLVLNILSENADNAILSGRRSQITISINYLCYSDLAGNYYVAYNSGNLTHVVTQIEPGLYEMDSMFGWPGAGYKVKFTDVCGTTQILNDWGFSNPIGGTGTLDYDTGAITFENVFVENVYEGREYTLEQE